MTLVSFKSNRISTNGTTNVPAVVLAARLVASTITTVQIHDVASGGTTSASTRVATLVATAGDRVDELVQPIRIGSGNAAVVAATGISVQNLYIYVR